MISKQDLKNDSLFPYPCLQAKPSSPHARNQRRASIDFVCGQCSNPSALGHRVSCSSSQALETTPFLGFDRKKKSQLTEHIIEKLGQVLKCVRSMCSSPVQSTMYGAGSSSTTRPSKIQHVESVPPGFFSVHCGCYKHQRL